MNAPEFSLSGYTDLLRAAQKAGYRVCRMDEAFAEKSRTFILRHDIDFSVECALEMAKLEHRLGVRATYFFMLTCEYYNLFSGPHRDMLREIVSLGHEVGLHWDSRFLPDVPQAHGAFFAAQIALLESVTGEKVRSASQHVPTDTPAFDITPFVENNAYSRRFNDRFAYVSDSSMTWREHTPYDLIAQAREIQFLAHPVWWVAGGATQDEKIGDFIRRLARSNESMAGDYLTYMKGRLAQRGKYDEYFRGLKHHQ